MKPSILRCAPLLFCLMCLPVQALTPPTDWRAQVLQAMRQWRVPGVAIVLVKQGHVALIEGYGVRAFGRNEAVDADTIFAIGSDTKAFTATLIGMLVDEERMQWDAPVSRYLPDFQLGDAWVSREITLRDLLAHRTGWSRADLLWHGSGLDRSEILRRLRHLPQKTSFRSRYDYNNLAYIVAGEAVAAAAGTSWDRLMHERIFRPLGMSRSSTRIADLAGQSNLASPHWITTTTVQPIARLDLDNLGPAGSIHTSAADLSRWLRFQLADGRFDGKPLISSSSLRQTRTAQVPVPHVDDPLLPSIHFNAYGMGWALFDYHGRTVIQHTGAVDGMQAEVVLVPEADFGFAVLSNAEGHDLTTALMYRLLDIHLGAADKDWSTLLHESYQQQQAAQRNEELREDARRVPGTHPSHALSSYVGTYSDPLYGDIEIQLSDNRLHLRFGPQHVAALTHRHYDTFVGHWRHPRLGTSTITFTTADDGAVQTMQVGNLGTFERQLRNEDAPR